jgi:hypothetical protein
VISQLPEIVPDVAVIAMNPSPARIRIVAAI